MHDNISIIKQSDGPRMRGLFFMYVNLCRLCVMGRFGILSVGERENGTSTTTRFFIESAGVFGYRYCI